MPNGFRYYTSPHCMVGAAMIAYRVYRIDESGHVQGVPDIIECEDDDDARIAAQRFLDGCGVEVWDGARKVAALPSVKKRRSSLDSALRAQCPRGAASHWLSKRILRSGR